MQDEKQIEFAFTIDDIKTMDRFFDARNRPNARRELTRMVVTLAVYGAFCLLARLFLGPGVWVTVGLVIDATCALIIGGVLLFRKRQAKRRYETLPPMSPQTFAARSLRLTPDGCVQQSAAGDGVTRWGAFSEIAETSGAVYLLLPKQGANGQQPGLVAPRHAFASGDEMRAFADLARGYWGAAQGGASANVFPTRTV